MGCDINPKPELDLDLRSAWQERICTFCGRTLSFLRPLPIDHTACWQLVMSTRQLDYLDYLYCGVCELDMNASFTQHLTSLVLLELLFGTLMSSEVDRFPRMVGPSGHDIGQMLIDACSFKFCRIFCALKCLLCIPVTITAFSLLSSISMGLSCGRRWSASTRQTSWMDFMRGFFHPSLVTTLC